MLEHEGFEVVQAKDGKEAVDLFFESPESFDCVLLDMGMPKLNGQEAATKIKEKNSDVPIVLLRGYDECEVNTHFNDSILAGTLQKPVSRKTLIETLGSVMNKEAIIKKAASPGR